MAPRAFQARSTAALVSFRQLALWPILASSCNEIVAEGSG